MNILILLEEGFEEIEALAVADILRRAELPVKLVSAKNTDYVVGAHEIIVKADMKISEVTKYDMVILPGGYPGYVNLGENTAVKELVDKAYRENKYIAAICGAPTVLGNWGYLSKRKACCFPTLENQLTGADVRFEKVIVDGNIITSRGAGTAHDFALKIVEILINKSKANKLRESMLY